MSTAETRPVPVFSVQVVAHTYTLLLDRVHPHRESWPEATATMRIKNRMSANATATNHVSELVYPKSSRVQHSSHNLFLWARIGIKVN